MRIAALSDFHIGVSSRQDGFGHDVRSFGRFLDELEGEHDRIVLLGDIFQTDHAPLATRRRRARDLGRARQRIGALARRFEQPMYTFVFGNHDAIAQDVCGAPETVRLSGTAASAFFVHGHQYDPVAQRAPWAALAGTWFTGRLRAGGLRSLATYFERRDVEVKDARFRGPAGPYVRAGRTIAQEQGANVVVMGHTHCARIDRVPEGVVVNTGTCSGGRTSYASVDLAAGAVTLVAQGSKTRIEL